MSLVFTPEGTPASPQEGEVYYDSTADKLKVRDASGFREVVSKESSGGIDIKAVNGSTTHTFTIKGIGEAIGDSQSGTSPDTTDSDSGQFTVYNGSTKLFGITEHGYVLKPNQPAFTVYRLDTSQNSDSYEITTTSGNLTDCVTSDGIETNIGNNWNHSSKSFTAPVSGNYFFSFNVSLSGTDGTTADNSLGFGFLVNNSKRSWTTYTSALSMTQSTTAFTSDGNLEIGSPTMIAILTISAGDYVKVGWQNLSKNLNVRSFIFSGYLIG